MWEHSPGFMSMYEMQPVATASTWPNPPRVVLLSKGIFPAGGLGGG